MDNALHELLYEHPDGVVVWFNEVLWKSKTEKQLSASKYDSYFPLIAPSVVTYYSRIRAWYFVPKGSGLQQQGGKQSKGNSSGSPHASVDDNDDASDLGETLRASSASRLGRSSSSTPSSKRKRDNTPVGRPKQGTPTSVTIERGEQQSSRIEIKKKKSNKLVAEEVLEAFAPAATTPRNAIVSQVIGKASSIIASGEAPDAPASIAPSKGNASSSGNTGHLPSSIDETTQTHSGGGGGGPNGPSNVSPKVSYQTRAQLEYLLFHNNGEGTALLQQFVPPKGSNRADVHNTTLFARWQPNYCYVERHVNKHSLNSASGGYSAQERGETIEGTRNTTSQAISNHLVINRLKDICNCLAEHCFFVAQLHMKQMGLVFKVDQNDQLVLLWCQEAVLAEREEILRSRNLVSNHTVALRESAVAKSGFILGASSIKQVMKASSQYKPQQHQQQTSFGGRSSNSTSPARQARSHSAFHQASALKHNPIFQPLNTSTTNNNNSRGRGVSKRAVSSFGRPGSRGGVSSSQGQHQRSGAHTRGQTTNHGRPNTAAQMEEFDYMIQQADSNFRKLSAAVSIGNGARRSTAAGASNGFVANKRRGIDQSKILDRVYGVSRSQSASLANVGSSPAFGGSKQLEDYVFEEEADDEAEEIIDDSRWGKPSQVDQALLARGAAPTPYALSKLAVDAGRFGLRDKYLATMRSPPEGVPSNFKEGKKVGSGGTSSPVK